MRKINTFLLALFIMLSCAIVNAQNAPDSTAPAPPPAVYTLKFVYIFEGDKTEVIMVMGNSGFRSVEALKNWVQGLPPGTSLELDMTCENFGIEPLINSEKDMADFKDFCAKHHINLIIKPAG